MNANVNISVDDVIETIVDMYIPMEDVEDSANSLDQNNFSVTMHKLKEISAECENILISILDVIIFTWMLNVRDEHKDVLKQYYNKFRRLDHEYGHLQYLHPFNKSMVNQNKFKDVHDIKEIISGILYSLKNIYEILNIQIKFELNVIPIFFPHTIEEIGIMHNSYYFYFKN